MEGVRKPADTLTPAPVMTRMRLQSPAFIFSATPLRSKVCAPHLNKIEQLTISAHDAPFQKRASARTESTNLELGRQVALEILDGGFNLAHG